MQVTFYNAFSKRKNSTKKPANTDTHYDIDVVLKEDTTIERPSLVLTNPAASASGNPVTVSSVAGNMVNPVVTLNVIQEGSGTPSPSNPRPISGYGDIQISVNGNITYITFDNVKYGGVLDVNTGMLTLKYAFVEYNGDASEDWFLQSINSYGIANFRIFLPSEQKNSQHIITNMFTWQNTVIAMTQDEGFLSNDGTAFFYVRVFSTRAATVNDFKIWLSQNPLQICYELKTPQTIQLTPTQIALAQGTNVVSTNGNSTISFGYLADELATDYCYAYIPKWNKYYFVATPTIITNNHIQYDLEEDYLASRKTEVGSTVAHIVYSSSGWDKDLTDARIGVKGTKTIYHDSQALPFNNSGCYILGVVNNQTDGKLGALSYYRMDAINIAKLIKWMMQDDFFTKISGYFNGKPLDFIQSCIWVPVSGSDYGNTMQTTLYLGDTAVADYSTVPETPV